MTRLFIGHKPGVGGVVKVMRDEGDDPLTTPNEDHGKFRFNSETTKIGYVDYFETYQILGGIPQNSDNYFPAGTGINNCLRHVKRLTSSRQYNDVFPSRILGRPAIPYVYEFRPKKSLGAEIEGPFADYRRRQRNTTTGAETGSNWGYPTTRMTLRATVGRISDNVVFDRPIVGWVGGSWESLSPNSFFSDGENQPMLVTVLDIPAGSEPMPTPPAGDPWTRNAIITPSLVRIATAGADADGAGTSGIIVDSTRVPMKVVRAGQINVSAGQSVDLLSPVTLNENSFMDYLVWRQGQTAYVPQIVAETIQIDQKVINMTYVILADRVRIWNRGNYNFTVRYMICHDDGVSTSDGAEVMRTLPGGHVQIKRPGSSDTAPASKDILLDTRSSYLPIIAEGWIPWGDFTTTSANRTLGDRYYTVNFPNDGSFLPFLKYYVTFYNDGNGFTEIRLPRTQVLRSSVPIEGGNVMFWQSSNGNVAILNDTSVQFWMARGHPSDLVLDGSGFSAEQENSAVKPFGIRYYIFGIPTNL